MPGNLFWPRYEKRETGTSGENWNDHRKTRTKMLDGLTNWLKVGRVIDTLKDTRDRDVGKIMIQWARAQHLID